MDKILFENQSLSEFDYVWLVRDFKKPKNSCYYDGLVTDIVSFYLPREDIKIYRDSLGKPMIEPAHDKQLFMSLAHSHDLLVIAISEDFPIGIDIEKITERRFRRRLASRYFAAHEQEQDLLGFYRSWTARESFVKVLGSGLAHNISRIEVKDNGDDMIMGMNQQWSHRAKFFSPVEGFLVAVCRDVQMSKEIKFRVLCQHSIFE